MTFGHIYFAKICSDCTPYFSRETIDSTSFYKGVYFCHITAHMNFKIFDLLRTYIYGRHISWPVILERVYSCRRFRSPFTLIHSFIEPSIFAYTVRSHWLNVIGYRVGRRDLIPGRDAGTFPVPWCLERLLASLQEVPEKYIQTAEFDLSVSI
jgi:hypothetical protein